MTFTEVGELLASVGIPAATHAGASSDGRFDDGSRYHFEIPSVEGPEVLRAVIDEASSLGVSIHRVSQGSGIMMQTDDELDELVSIAVEQNIEVCLFLGPRGAWDAGGQSLATDVAAGAARGAEALEACVAEARRAAAHGIGSVLVGDIGVLDVLAKLRAIGELPADLRFKTSVVIGAANPAAASVLERLGADTINIATDLEVEMIAAIRGATKLPLDVYVEVPDDMGGFVRGYLVPDIVRVAAPVHIKLGLRNATSVYPSGRHLTAVASIQAREKVRRAALLERLIREMAPELTR
jgi:hypothetical protein